MLVTERRRVMTLGQWLYRRRMALSDRRGREITQREIAQRVGRDTGWYHRMERDKRAPGLTHDEVRDLATALECSPLEILEAEGYPVDTPTPLWSIDGDTSITEDEAIAIRAFLKIIRRGRDSDN